MAQFPSKEADVVVLAQDLTAGLNANATLYPAPPVAPADLAAKLSDYVTARDAAVAAQAAAEQATATKNEALDALADDMKADLRYAENTVDFNDEKLKLLGWGGRKARTSLQEPGQCRALEAPRQGEGWIFLDWKAPADGGKVAAYTVQRRDREAGTDWLNAATAIDSEATLVEQPRGKELEYRVLALNKAGEGQPSNTVMAVL